jgi:hypothetical protein
MAAAAGAVAAEEALKRYVRSAHALLRVLADGEAAGSSGGGGIIGGEGSKRWQSRRAEHSVAALELGVAVQRLARGGSASDQEEEHGDDAKMLSGTISSPSPAAVATTAAAALVSRDGAAADSDEAAVAALQLRQRRDKLRMVRSFGTQFYVRRAGQ